MNRPAPGTIEFEVFFDGDCPLCRREIGWIRRLDRQNRIEFTDIASPDFDPTPLGVDLDALMAEIHGRLPDGTLVKGVEVFRRLYAAVGGRLPVAVSRWPGISHLLDLGYSLFAKNRLWLTGRCGTDCTLKNPAALATGQKTAALPTTAQSLGSPIATSSPGEIAKSSEKQLFC